MSTFEDLFSASEYSEQAELLRLEPVPRTLERDFPRPVAHVVVDLPQIQMDHVFDYEIPQKYADVVVGARIRVPIGSRKVTGFVVGRSAQTRYGTQLRLIDKVISNIPVLSSDILELARAVGQRQIAPVSDVLRLAIPQRHARAENDFFARDIADPALPAPVKDVGEWSGYDAGPALIDHLSAGTAVRAGVTMRASDHALDMLLVALRAVTSGGRTAIVVLPTAGMVAAYASALRDRLGVRVATFDSSAVHEVRYTQFLLARFGGAQVVVGTRSAVWAPIANLGAVFIVDDQHAAHQEPRSPYIHARDVLTLRSELAACAFVCLNHGPSLELSLLCAGWAQPVSANQPSAADCVPQIVAAASYANEGGEMSRMPASVFAVIRDGLTRGHVLVAVPKSGYITGVACAKCREFMTCTQCSGSIQISEPHAPARCGRCGVSQPHCSHCGHTNYRVVKVGSQRTAQEIGRAFRGVPIHLAHGDDLADAAEASIVVATPGAIPRVEGGYSAAVILDAGFLLRAGGERAEQYFLRNIAHVARCVRPRSRGGRVLVVGDVPQSLISIAARWSFHQWAMADLRERTELMVAPAAVWVQVRGEHGGLRDLVGALVAFAPAGTSLQVAGSLGLGIAELLPGLAVVGPVPGDDEDTMYLRFARQQRSEFTALLDRAYRDVVQRGWRIRIRVDTSADG